jgi:hypothetical protein
VKVIQTFAPGAPLNLNVAHTCCRDHPQPGDPKCLLRNPAWRGFSCSWPPG